MLAGALGEKATASGSDSRSSSAISSSSSQTNVFFLLVNSKGPIGKNKVELSSKFVHSHPRPRFIVIRNVME